MKTEREKFEEWYTKTNQSNINDSCWCIGGFYTDRVVQRSWEAWQAAKADAVLAKSIPMTKSEFSRWVRYCSVADEEFAWYIEKYGDFKRWDFVKLDQGMCKTFKSSLYSDYPDCVFVVRDNMGDYLSFYGTDIIFLKKLFVYARNEK